MQFSTSSLTALSSFGKARRNKFGLGSALIFVIVGCVFIAVSLIFLNDEIKSRNWPTVPGKVIHVDQSTNSDGDRMYTPTVSYTVKGATYSVRQPYSTGGVVRVGDGRSVRYNPNDPADGTIALSGGGFFLYVFPLIGVLAIVGSVIGFIRSSRRSAAITRLKQSGIKLQGIVTGMESTSRQGAVRLGVSATDPTGQVRTYVSDYVAGNTFGLLDFQTNPIAMDVYVDTTNPDNYYVDLDDIPTLSPEKLTSLIQAATAGMRPGTPAGQPGTTFVPPAVPTGPTPVVPPAGTDSTTVPPANNYR